MILIYSILFITLFDYIVYNLWGRNFTNQIINPYRILFAILQIGITLMLLLTNQVTTSFLFIFLWWCGVCDMFYYMIDWIVFKVFGKSFENGIIREYWNIRLDWLQFTVLGLIRRNGITGKELFIQNSVGIVISFFIMQLKIFN